MSMPGEDTSLSLRSNSPANGMSGDADSYKDKPTIDRAAA